MLCGRRWSETGNRFEAEVDTEAETEYGTEYKSSHSLFCCRDISERKNVEKREGGEKRRRKNSIHVCHVPYGQTFGGWFLFDVLLIFSL